MRNLRARFRFPMAPVRFASAALLLLALAFPAAPTLGGDPEKGAKVFRKCKACHAMEAGKHKLGPSLHGVFGRVSGSVADFTKYSKAMKAAAVVWDDETLDAYLKAPKKFIKGGRMAFAGLKKQKDRDDVIAYLKDAGG